MTPTTDFQVRRFVDGVGIILVVVGMLLGFIPGFATPIAEATGTGHPLAAGEFEIDGNTGGDHDWAGQGGERTADGVANTDATWFKASIKESSYPNFEFEPGGNSPKADLERMFVQSQVGADSFIWLGATRVSDSGNVQVSAEVNKSALTYGDLAGAYRQAGDIYIQFNFPGSQGGAVTAGYKIWNGASYGPRIAISGSDLRAAVGTLGGENREFVELEINLDAFFGDGGPTECASYRSVFMRTESSGGNEDNNDPTLKDVTVPVPVEIDTCGEVTVEKVDAEGNALDGAEFTLYEGADTTGAVMASCTTSGGACSLGDQLPGTYTVDETGVPDGYTKAPGLPATFDVTTAADVVLGPYTDERIDYTISVVDDGINAVGNDHVFTATLTSDEGPMVGATLHLVWTGDGDGITAIDGVAVGPFASTTCTTDGAGQCTATVSSDVPGSGAIAASWDTPYQNTIAADPAVATTGGDPVSSIEDDATKRWIGFLAEIEETATNLAGDEHVFIAAVKTFDGVTSTPALGAKVTVDWDGPVGSTIDSTVCVTGRAGTCTFTVNSAIAGVGTISIVEVDGLIGNQQAFALNSSVARVELEVEFENIIQDLEELTVTFPVGEISATKTWLEYRATIDLDSTNPTGQSHTFAVQVEVNDGSGWTAAGENIIVGWNSVGKGGDDLGASTCDDGTDANGQCTIAVTSTAPGSRTVTLTDVNGDLTGEAGSNTESVEVSDAATKTWLDFTVDVTPDGDNLVGEPHTFTVVIQQYDGESYSFVDNGSVVEFTTSDDGASLVSETCSLGTINGVCQVVVQSEAGASMTLTVTGIDGYTGFDVPTDVIFEEAGTATKTWYAYRAWIEADAVNFVGDAHDFTVTAQVDDGSGWAAVPDGTVVTVTSSGAGTVDQSDCADGTTGGSCIVTVNSDVASAVTVTVATVENLAAIDSDVAFVDVSEGADLDGQSTSAEKAWIDYAIDVTPDTDDNLVDTDHVFTVTLTTTVPTEGGAVTEPVVGVSPVTILDGAGAIVGNDCEQNGTDANGQCTVTISSSAAGSFTSTASFVGSVAGTEAEGDEESREYSDTADKLWWDYQLTIDPQEAINAVGDEHTFTATLLVDTGDGFLPAVGETVDVELGGDTGAVVSETCTTATDEAGQCTIVVNSDSPGTTSVGVSYDAVAGATSATFSDEGTKWWTDIQLVKVPIAGDDAEDGDLTFEFGKFVLSFSDSDPGPKTAVYEFTITNTGPVTLENIALTDDRLGTILDGSEGIVLEAGETHVVRASEDFSLDDLPGDVVAGDQIDVTNVAGVTGHPVEDPDVTVSDDDDAEISLTAVQGVSLVPGVDLTKRVVFADEDPRSDLTRDEDRVDPDDATKFIGAGAWSSEETRANAPKTFVFEFVITNTGSATIFMPVLTDVMDLNTGLLADGSIPLQTIVVLDGTEGIVLAPGQSHTERLAVTYTPEQFFNDAELATLRSLEGSGSGYSKDHNDVATVETTLISGGPGPSASDDAKVGMQAVLPEQIANAGFGAAGRLLPLALFLNFVGLSVLVLDRRRGMVG